MKLEVGMYVRTNLGIAKIIKAGERKGFDNKYLIDKEYLLDKEIIDTHEDYYTNCMYDYKFYLEQIIKTSHNIIDLIEVGDYVNGDYVWEDTDGAYFKKGTMWVGDVEQGDYLNKTKIETIVTREQFEAMQYKVVEE